MSSSGCCHMPLLYVASRPASQTYSVGARCCQSPACVLAMARGQSCSAGCRVCVLLFLDCRRRPLQQARPGWCCVPRSCAPEIFCRMLFAVPVLLICNVQRPKILHRLRCVPARLPSRLHTQVHPPKKKNEMGVHRAAQFSKVNYGHQQTQHLIALQCCNSKFLSTSPRNTDKNLELQHCSAINWEWIRFGKCV